MLPEASRRALLSRSLPVLLSDRVCRGLYHLVSCRANSTQFPGTPEPDIIGPVRGHGDETVRDADVLGIAVPGTAPQHTVLLRFRRPLRVGRRRSFVIAC